MLLPINLDNSYWLQLEIIPSKFWIVISSTTVRHSSRWRINIKTPGVRIFCNDTAARQLLYSFIDVMKCFRPFLVPACWYRRSVLAGISPSSRGRPWSGPPPPARWRTPPESRRCSWGPAPASGRRCRAWQVWSVRFRKWLEMVSPPYL